MAYCGSIPTCFVNGGGDRTFAGGLDEICSSRTSLSSFKGWLVTKGLPDGDASCAAVRSTTIETTPAVRIATTTILTTVTTTSVFVCVRLPHHYAYARNATRLRLGCRGFFDGAGKILAYSARRAEYKTTPRPTLRLSQGRRGAIAK